MIGHQDMVQAEETDVMKLKVCVERMHKLLADPQPGLWTWWDFMMQEIKQFRKITDLK